MQNWIDIFQFDVKIRKRNVGSFRYYLGGEFHLMQKDFYEN